VGVRGGGEGGEGGGRGRCGGGGGCLGEGTSGAASAGGGRGGGGAGGQGGRGSRGGLGGKGDTVAATSCSLTGPASLSHVTRRTSHANSHKSQASRHKPQVTWQTPHRSQVVSQYCILQALPITEVWRCDTEPARADSTTTKLRDAPTQLELPYSIVPSQAIELSAPVAQPPHEQTPGTPVSVSRHVRLRLSDPPADLAMKLQGIPGVPPRQAPLPTQVDGYSGPRLQGPVRHRLTPRPASRAPTAAFTQQSACTRRGKGRRVKPDCATPHLPSADTWISTV